MMIIDDLSTWDIVVVDDEPDSLGVLSYVLDYHKAKVRLANGGSKALELIRQSPPSLLLLDIQMPELSGWDVLKIIRADDELRHLPVIAVTAYVMNGDRERILEAGFDGYIPKPISPLGLINYLKSVLHPIAARSDYKLALG